MRRILACTALSLGSALAEASEIETYGWAMEDLNIVDAGVASLDISDSELRRARFGVKGELWGRLKYKGEINYDPVGDTIFDDPEFTFTDLYVQYDLIPGTALSFKLGQHKEHVSLDEETSAKYTSVVERAAFTDAFDIGRRVGLSVLSAGENYSFAAGVYGDNTEDVDAPGGWSASARGTVMPINGSGRLVHFGAAIRHRWQRDGAPLLRYRQRPFAHIPGRIISTGPVAEADTLVGVESLVMLKSGRFWGVGEIGLTFAEGSDEGVSGDADLGGGYLEFGAFLGGRQTYRNGHFGRPMIDRPVTQGGWGGARLVARYDTVDLTEGGVNGGSLNTLVFGADWFATKFTRLSVNYFTGDARPGRSASGLDPRFVPLLADGVRSETVDGLVIRAQLAFGSPKRKF